MSLQIRRGTDATRQTIIFDQGEITWTTDTNKLFVGDGSTAGGINVIASAAGTGLTWNSTTNTLNFTASGLGIQTNQVSESSGGPLYFTTARAQAAAASMFTAIGTATVTGTITGTTSPNQVTVSSTTGMTALIPFTVSGNSGVTGGLGNGTYYIVSVVDSTHITVASSLANAQAGTTVTTLTTATMPGGVNFSAGGGSAGDVTFVYNSVAGTMSANVSLNATGISSLYQDTNPTLGANLTLNGFNITGTGNVSVTGNISGSGTLGAGNTTVTGTLAVSSTSTFTGAATFNNKIRINGAYISIAQGENSVFLQNTRLTVISDTTDTDTGINVLGSSTGSATATGLAFATSRGTSSAPSVVQTGDVLSAITANVYNGSSYVGSGIVSFFVDSVSVPTGGVSVPTKLLFLTATGYNTPSTIISSGYYNQISSNGVLTSPQIKAVNSIQLTSSGGAISSSTTYTSISGASIIAAATYSNVSQSATSGTGAGAVFTIIKTGPGTTYTGVTSITMVQPGIGYNIGDTITIPGTSLGGTSPGNDLVFTLATYVVNGVGYSTGSGGTVTQSTSKATGVTLNKPTGTIVLNNASLAAGTVVSFTFTNGNLNSNDMVVINHSSGGTLGAYSFAVTPALGSCTVYVRNNTAGALAEALTLQFAVIKSAVA